MIARTLGLLAVAFPLVTACAVAQEAGELSVRGKAVFTEEGCYGCHTVGKTGTPIAPDLSTIGAKYSRAFLERWLRDPAEQKPTAHMPRIQLDDREVEALAAYLASLR